MLFSSPPLLRVAGQKQAVMDDLLLLFLLLHRRARGGRRGGCYFQFLPFFSRLTNQIETETVE